MLGGGSQHGCWLNENPGPEMRGRTPSIEGRFPQEMEKMALRPFFFGEEKVPGTFFKKFL